MVDKAVRRKAFEIMREHGFWWETLDEVRELVRVGKPDDAKQALIFRFEMTESDADAVLAYFDPAVKGRPVAMTEIAVAEIDFPRFDESTDEAPEDEDEDDDYEEGDDDDPLEPGVRYFARLGVDIGPMRTTSSHVDGVEKDMVWFGGKVIEPSLLDQVWRVDELEAEGKLA